MQIKDSGTWDLKNHLKCTPQSEAIALSCSPQNKMQGVLVWKSRGWVCFSQEEQQKERQTKQIQNKQDTD